MKRKEIGFLTVEERDDGVLSVYYGGNMGASIIRNVDPLLLELGYPRISTLKEEYPNYTETGSPDYAYNASFDTGYVTLSDDDVVQAGDQWRDSLGRWRDFEHHIGLPVSSTVYPVRRPVVRRTSEPVAEPPESDKHYLLRDGVILAAGDEYWHDGGWRPIPEDWIGLANDEDPPFRRPYPTISWAQCPSSKERADRFAANKLANLPLPHHTDHDGPNPESSAGIPAAEPVVRRTSEPEEPNPAMSLGQWAAEGWRRLADGEVAANEDMYFDVSENAWLGCHEHRDVANANQYDVVIRRVEQHTSEPEPLASAPAQAGRYQLTGGKWLPLPDDPPPLVDGELIELCKRALIKYINTPAR